MARKTPEQKLQEFLEKEEAKKQLQSCVVCANETVREIVSLHLDKLQRGDTTITLSHLHKNLLVELGGPKSYEVVKRHVRKCLKRDVRTGEALDV